MSGVRGTAGVGAAIAIGLALTACGGSGAAKTPVAAAGRTPAPTPPTVTPAQGPTTAAAVTPRPPAMSPSLSANALFRGLLPATEFGPRMKDDPADPVSQNDLPGDTSAVTGSADCALLVQGGARRAGLAMAEASGSRTSGSGPQGFFERAEQYDPGSAAIVLASMTDQANTNCAAYVDRLGDGTKVTGTLKATAVSGLGQKAAMFEGVESLPGGATVSDALTADFGDVLVTAGCSGTSAQVRTCKLDAKVKKIAALLRIS
jgi:hypothetical protein